MNGKHGAVVIVLLALLAGTRTLHARSTRAAVRFQSVSYPGVPPRGQCCLFRLHQHAEGKRLPIPKNPKVSYQCAHQPGVTRRDDTTILLTLKREGQCDEVPQGLVLASLKAVGNTIRRADDFAHFFGRFEIRDPSGLPLFSGVLELFDRVGTHHPPFGTEACDQKSHQEGWLVGTGQGAARPFTLRALIVANGVQPVPGDDSAALNGSIDGALVQCH
jgi:hypothetical protein